MYRQDTPLLPLKTIFSVHILLAGRNYYLSIQPKKENIHVTIDGNQIAISAEVKNEKEVKEGEKVICSERYYGKVSRSFGLAQEVDENTSQAKYSDGVLELTLIKKATAKMKRLRASHVAAMAALKAAQAAAMASLTAAQVATQIEQSTAQEKALVAAHTAHDEAQSAMTAVRQAQELLQTIDKKEKAN